MPPPAAPELPSATEVDIASPHWANIILDPPRFAKANRSRRMTRFRPRLQKFILAQVDLLSD